MANEICAPRSIRSYRVGAPGALGTPYPLRTYRKLLHACPQARAPGIAFNDDHSRISPRIHTATNAGIVPRQPVDRPYATCESSSTDSPACAPTVATHGAAGPLANKESHRCR